MGYKKRKNLVFLFLIFTLYRIIYIILYDTNKFFNMCKANIYFYCTFLICSVCGKGKVSGNQVSHSNRHSRRTWSANLRNVRAIIDGTPKRVKVCTRCLRSGKIERA